MVGPGPAAKLLDAKTPEQTKAAIAAIESSLGGVVWSPVGGNPTNHGTIELGMDPAAQLLERVVNAQEACLELEALRRRASASSPHDAAAKWFGVPANGLTDMSDADVRALAERTVQVTMAESGAVKRPTVIITDQGMGQHPCAFPSTLVGLSQSEKIEKPYLVGQYGQGGASTLMHSDYTIIASRRAPDLLKDGESDVIGFTVVRYRKGKVKGGVYEYLCGPNEAILAVSPADLNSPLSEHHGTRITHVAYELHGYTAVYRRNKTGLWALLNAGLFEPVLPVHITGEREVDLKDDKKANVTGRIAKGNVAVVAGLPPCVIEGSSNSQSPKKGSRRGTTCLRWEDEQVIQITDGTTEHGRIRVRIWVLGHTGNTDNYVRADQTITFTRAGQRHGQEGRDFLKKCKLGFLSKRTIIQVDADGLNHEAKRRLFPSGRERQRKNEMSELVLAHLADYLDNEDLKALEEEARAEELARSSKVVRDAVRRRVAKLINRRLAGSGGPPASALPGGATMEAGGKVGRTPAARHAPKPPPDDSAMPTIPTRIELKGAPKIAAGRSGQMVLTLDAKNGYLGEHADDLQVDFDGEAGGRIRRRGTGTVRGGKARVMLAAAKDTPPGKYRVRVSLIVSGGKTLTSVGEIEILPEPALAGGQRIADAGLPDIRWVKHHSEAADPDEEKQLKEDWPDGWDIDTVGDVIESTGQLVLRLNESLPSLKNAMLRRASGERASKERVQSFKDRYAGPVAYGMWLLHRDRFRRPS